MASPQISQNDKSDYRSNTDSLPTHKRNTYTKLDLIFEREPKEVQDKLVKLLINYNAVMQYVLKIRLRTTKKVFLR